MNKFPTEKQVHAVIIPLKLLANLDTLISLVEEMLQVVMGGGRMKK